MAADVPTIQSIDSSLSQKIQILPPIIFRLGLVIEQFEMRTHLSEYFTLSFFFWSSAIIFCLVIYSFHLDFVYFIEFSIENTTECLRYLFVTGAGVNIR